MVAALDVSGGDGGTARDAVRYSSRRTAVKLCTVVGESPDVSLLLLVVVGKELCRLVERGSRRMAAPAPESGVASYTTFHCTDVHASFLAS